MNANLIENMLKNIENCLEKEVGFEVRKLQNKIRVLTPFLYNDNDHIELFIFIDKQSNFIYISDEGLTAEKFFEVDQEFLSELSKNIGISFNQESLSFYKKFKKLNKSYSLLRKIIDFSNNLQRLETLYLFLINNRIINIQITHNIYVKSNKNKIEKFLLRKIKEDINKNWKRTLSSVIKEEWKTKLVSKHENDKLEYVFKIEPNN